MNTDVTEFEPGAAHVSDDEGAAPALASIAISLKRIADVLVTSFGDDARNEYGEGPAQAIGGGISRALRGVGS